MAAARPALRRGWQLVMTNAALSLIRGGRSSWGRTPSIALAYGLAVLDLISVGNSCDFAQRAYYEAFLRESGNGLAPVRVRVEQYYSKDKLMCVAP